MRKEIKQLLALSIALLLIVSIMAIMPSKERSGDSADEIEQEQIVSDYVKTYIDKAKSDQKRCYDASGILEGVEYTSIIKSHDWSGEDEQVLLRIAMAEAEGEGEYGMALVMLVVLNRTLSDDFPDDIESVVFQPGQFEPVSNGRYDSVEISDACRKALDVVKSGWDRSFGALYFESCSGESWQSTNRTLLFQYKGHKFYA